jgi:type IV pilus assembly protein PilY1
MTRKFLSRAGAFGLVLIALGLISVAVMSDPTFTAGTPPNIAQEPLYMRDSVPPLNMLVMGKDHKNYYEAYNDASDLDGDRALDVGYRGWQLKSPAPAVGESPYKIDYYGYFNSFACYDWDAGKNRFYPVSSTPNKQCPGHWSGDFLNYLTTSRMDALRRVLYGGWRQTDGDDETVLQGAFFPQDAHSWGKEYQGVDRDEYDISLYTPLSAPASGKYHLFAVTTLTNNSAPLLRVMQNTTSRVWNWLSIEGPVAGNKCFTSTNTRVTCDGTRNDYAVRVLSCPDTPATARESTCKAYPNGHFKPTGILHDYGESQRMYFGLITGSQGNNLEGGVLRRNISDFAEEIDSNTGVFKTSVDGIARNIDRLRMIGGGYNGGVTNNAGGDTNWNWANAAFGVGGNCQSQGGRPLNNGECRMWGNPIAEMMFEGLRYFAGAAAPTARFSTGGSTQGVAEDAALALSAPGWKDPYKPASANGLGYPKCAKPNETVISDINPSYDGDLPGSAFASIGADAATPGFSAAGEGDVIWNSEFGGGARNVFIGEVGGVTDGAPTAKSASSFGNIRGLAPEEPTKGGTYYAASVARYGRHNDLNAVDEAQNLSTYSIALASPLPRIEFPVSGGGIVTLLPFAKTASGTFGEYARKPTNTIVDFYVQKIVNIAGAPSESGPPSNGRPYAVFRINYEDVEQGNDHDMDAIVIYEIKETGGGQIQVSLTSEYAAGSADQNIGYSITGTTQDGIYLDVRDTDSGAGSFRPYDLNTPNPILPGGCKGVVTGPCGKQLPLVSSRIFTPSAGGRRDGEQLKNPLWYAAKYGAPAWPIWDEDNDKEPDNYFLVTNPLNLRAQLSKAFDDIANRDLDVGSTTISGARVGNSSFTVQPTFRRDRNGKDWTGNLTATAIDPNTGSLLTTALWRAQDKLPPAAGAKAPSDRNIRVMTKAGVSSTKEAAEFRAGNLGPNNTAQLIALGINPTTVSDNSKYGAAYSADDFVAYLRGDQSREASRGGGNTLRTRSSVLGDIVNSQPIVVSPRSDYGYASYTSGMFSGYAGYVAAKASSGRKPVAYVGANDGMLHAFDASTQPCPNPDQRLACNTGGSGEELFAFIPNASLGKLGSLALPDRNFNHLYYVDGQLTAGDAKDGSTWKTLLIGAMAGGGQSIFALDAGNPDSFSDDDVLWERNRLVDLDIGNIYGKPLLLPLQSGKWGVVFGNGYGGQRSDPSLYILDAFTGELIRKITADDGNLASGTLSPITDFICTVLPIGEYCARKVDPFNGLGQITAIDADGDGMADTVYGGDLQGNLWKFDLSSGSDADWGVAFGGSPLFNAVTGTERQPITGGIRVAAGPGGGYMVYFGTGRYFVTGDNSVSVSPQVQSLYGVWDNLASPAGGRGALTAQSITSEQVVVDDNGTPGNSSDDITYTVRNISRNLVQYYGASAVRGWYLDLKIGANGSGERFVATPRIQSGRVFFATYTPKQDSCAPGGSNFAYGLDLLSGTGALANISVLPRQTPACTGSDCGAVAVSHGSGGEVQPPIVDTSVGTINPIKQLCPPGGPVTPQCPAPGGPSFEQCQVVIYPGAFVLPRACGRQSWRQLK